jgi:hypothetical protein
MKLLIMQSFHEEQVMLTGLPTTLELGLNSKGYK